MHMRKIVFTAAIVQERAEFRAAKGLPEQFDTPDDAKRIFRFDDLATDVHDAASLKVKCLCRPNSGSYIII